MNTSFIKDNTSAVAMDMQISLHILHLATSVSRQGKAATHFLSRLVSCQHNENTQVAILGYEDPYIAQDLSEITPSV